jgi:hypothetical protein
VGILWGILIFVAGLYLGFFIRALLARRTSYTGVIHIYDGKEKTVYSLELNEYPEEIRFKKEVIFKVDAPEENLNRD